MQVAAKFALACSGMIHTLAVSVMEQPRAGEAPQRRDRLTLFNFGGRYAQHSS